MLLEVEGEQVRVLAGLGMRARLVQVLGPVRALRVAQAVARMGGPVLGVDWGRRRFLGRALGALAGLLLIRHAGQAVAAPPPPTSGGLPIQRSRRLEGRERAQALQHLQNHPDLKALGLTVPPDDGEFPLVIAHELADGNTLEAAAWPIGEREILTAYVFKRPVHIGQPVIHSEAAHLAFEGKEIRLLARSVNGRPTSGTRAGDGTAIQPMSHCPGCSGNCWIGPYEIDCQSCASWDGWCIARCCVACVAPCVKCGAAPNPVDCGLCFACGLIWCPWCSSTCCTRWVHDCCPCSPCPGP